MITAAEASRDAYDSMRKKTEQAIINAITAGKNSCDVNFHTDSHDKEHFTKLCKQLLDSGYNIKLFNDKNGYTYFEITW